MSNRQTEPDIRLAEVMVALSLAISLRASSTSAILQVSQ